MNDFEEQLWTIDVDEMYRIPKNKGAFFDGEKAEKDEPREKETHPQQKVAAMTPGPAGAQNGDESLVSIVAELKKQLAQLQKKEELRAQAAAAIIFAQPMTDDELCAALRLSQAQEERMRRALKKLHISLLRPQTNQPKRELTGWQLRIVVESACEAVGMKTKKWKPFERLWGKTNLKSERISKSEGEKFRKRVNGLLSDV